MCSRFLRNLRNLGIISLFAATIAGSACATELRICADPDNLPFSNNEQQGFENKIADLIAGDMHAQVNYVWQRMGRGFVREYIDKRRCDLLIGIPAGFQQMLTTQPYYRSTYVFLVRRGARVKPTSLDDPALCKLKIAVQAVDEQYVPPGDALARRGMQSSMVPFYGVGKSVDAIARAVADQKVDAALLWGPLAGFLARPYGDALEILPVKPEVDTPNVPFTFQIAMGVRKGNDELRSELEQILLRRMPEIQRILSAYGVPQLQLISAKKDAD
jgi:quinoprotein dehydrogenase-associated probable ABC transporter substrate-binding protein